MKVMPCSATTSAKRAFSDRKPTPGWIASAPVISAADSSAAVTPKSDDQLKLTDSARALQEAARLDTSSAIDTKRVEQIREALASGSYQIDAGRIADRMLSFERQIGAGAV